MKRRKFIKTSALAMASPAILSSDSIRDLQRNTKPVVISTWRFGEKANPVAMDILESGGYSLDAVEAGVKVIEADPEIHSVGYGGYPDRDGNVTCDASIMDDKGQAGSVAYLKNIKHAISVARKVMEETDHVMLVGDGALEFAKSQGFKEENLLTDKALQKWKDWKMEQSLRSEENHDTIAMLAQDKFGHISGACTTSGMAQKMPGRVGDSPIIGAGLYVDNKIGAAGATGVGEEIIKIAGSFLIVEFMRQGYSPEDACWAAIDRLHQRHGGKATFQTAFIALRKDGAVGSAAMNGDYFRYVVSYPGNMEIKSVTKK
ncbi:MAG: N(4)-(beta-N-acetylglucosaminyl)-L-asparaginase [Candidatus Marinimicrobia bacterium]|nr:N(4)-(beta-N-acetylglucosaminyl)-L-asparaginase [Candidatus Neomarinimicrobiota bacterium]